MPKCLLIAGIATLLGQGQTAFTLAGVVVKDGTNQPLNHVLVTIANAQRREWHLSYITDTDGRFVFPNLPGGKWDLSAEKNGYPAEPYQGNEGYSTAVAVGAGIDSTHIVFPLSPAGILSGTVVDDQGDPVRQAQIMLFRTGVSYGKLSTQNVGAAQTDAGGEFSVGSLRPGIYYVAVTARPWYAKNFSQPLPENGPASTEAAQRDERDVAYPITYYGDVTDGASAEPIAIKEGTEERIRITLHPVPAWQLKIRNESGRGFTLMTLGPGGVRLNMPFITTGTGEILGVPSGRYIVQAPGSSPQFVDVTGDREIDIRAPSPVSLTGHVTWEGPTARRPDQVSIDLAGDDETNSVMVRVQADGSLHLDENNVLAQGRYRISLQAAPGYAIRSVQAKGARYANGLLEIAGDEAVDLSITATSGLAKLDGIATRDNAPCPAVMILLLPANGNPDSIRRDQSDSDGTFTLPDVLPGRYTLVAIDNGRDLAYQDPAVMAKYLAQGQSVEVPRKDQTRLTIAVQPRQP